jgi:hypothetical protein
MTLTSRVRFPSPAPLSGLQRRSLKPFILPGLLEITEFEAPGIKPIQTYKNAYKPKELEIFLGMSLNPARGCA